MIHYAGDGQNSGVAWWCSRLHCWLWGHILAQSLSAWSFHLLHMKLFLTVQKHFFSIKSSKDIAAVIEPTGKKSHALVFSCPVLT